MKDYSIAPVALMAKLVSGGLVPVYHQFGEPSGYTQKVLDNGDILHSPVYTPRIHDLLIPVEHIQVRTHQNGRNYLCYNPLYKHGRTDNTSWNIIRADGGSADIIFRMKKPLPDIAKIKLSCRETPFNLPKDASEFRTTIVNCADIANAAAGITIESLDADFIVDISNFDIEVQVTSYGRLITAEKNVMPQWSH